MEEENQTPSEGNTLRKKEGNLHEESIKYELLEVLKNEKIHEPFTTEKEIWDYQKLE